MSPEAPSDGQSPVAQRELRDPRALRAYTHPLRLRILDELIDHGPATATELAERIDESPANLSWHLRTLARYGFIEEAAARGGRQRPWQVIPQSIRPASDPDPELARAEDAAGSVLALREAEALNEWRIRRHDDTVDWQEASWEHEVRVWLTADELAALKKATDELLRQFGEPRLNRVDPASRPAGARPVRLVNWAVPGPPSTQTRSEDADDG